MMSRDDVMDIAKGIAIISIVLGHSLPESIAKNILYSFHVPLFFFISGYFQNSTNVGKITIKRLRQLSIPYLVTVLCMAVFSMFLNLENYNIEEHIVNLCNIFISSIYAAGVDVVSPFFVSQIGAIWFLPALTLSSICFAWVTKESNRRTLVIICCALICYWLSKEFWLPLSILAIPFCTIFMLIGYWVRRNSVLDGFMRFKNKKILYLIPTVIWIFGVLKGGLVLVTNNSYPNLFWNLVEIISGIICMIVLSCMIKNVPVLGSFMCGIGKNTLTIICIYAVDLKCIIWKPIINRLGVYGGVKYAICLYFFHSIFIALGLFIVYVVKQLFNKVAPRKSIE